MRLVIFSRHANSNLNVEGRVNGDPSLPVSLTESGRAEARSLGLQLAHVGLELCVHTRFGRTRETASLALGGRGVPFVVEPLLDDINVGDLEGVTIEAYRAWKREHARSEPFPGGESLDDAGRRYVEGYRKLLERPECGILVVCHEIPIRYGLNAAGGSDDLDAPVRVIPNATPYLFDETMLAAAAERIAALVPGA
ncbi:MAG: histidine phosphatase family protein [Gaiellaceae bacterium]